MIKYANSIGIPNQVNVNLGILFTNPLTITIRAGDFWVEGHRYNLAEDVIHTLVSKDSRRGVALHLVKEKATGKADVMIDEIEWSNPMEDFAYDFNATDSPYELLCPYIDAIVEAHATSFDNCQIHVSNTILEG
jgi:hypothetical protein